jgi:hypothetical protein
MKLQLNYGIEGKQFYYLSIINEIYRHRNNVRMHVKIQLFIKYEMPLVSRKPSRCHKPSKSVSPEMVNIITCSIIRAKHQISFRKTHLAFKNIASVH